MTPKEKKHTHSIGQLVVPLFPVCLNAENLQRFSTKRVCVSTLLVIAGLGVILPSAAAADFTFQGNALRVLEETPERSTGLDKIYVCYDTTNVNAIYTTSNPSNVKIYKYGNLGGAYSEELTNVSRTADSVIINNVEGNYGYIVEDNGNRYYFWIVDYLPYRFKISSISLSSELDCDATLLDVVGEGEAIHYFTINGQQKTLSREIEVAYRTQEWSEEQQEYATIEKTSVFDALTPQLRISPPVYCSTSFHISGDKFLEVWNWLAEAESIVEAPHAVAVATEAIQEDSTTGTSTTTTDADEDSDDAESTEPVGCNQISSGDEGLGGSAPAEIEFRAYATEGVIHHEWQMSSDPEFNEVDYRFNEQNLTYTFNDEGTFYLRYIGSNSDGSCDAIGETYTVNIGASELLCPNAFTPDGDGVNDEWKVSYRSIIDFKCWIFDRYGAQLCYFTDPSLGWDGMRGGKVVKPGVYYYVIQAEGADGKKYKLSGDINIIRHNVASSTTINGAE